MAVPVSIKNLKAGWTTAERVISDDGRTLVQSGVVLTDGLIDKLQKFCLTDDMKDCYIKVTASKEDEAHLIKVQEQDVDNVVSEEEAEIQDETVIALRKTYLTSTKSLQNTMHIINSCIKNITYQVQRKADLSYSLGQYKEESDLYEHSFRVAQFAVTLANIYNQKIRDSKNKVDLEVIGTAALLHDYGVRFHDPDELRQLASFEFSQAFIDYHQGLDPDILRKPYNEKYHTVYAYAALKNSLPNSVVHTILRSSEKDSIIFNTNEVSNKNTPTYISARMIQICNLYDSLLSNVIRNNLSLENVSTTLEQLAENKIINKELTTLFLDNIPLYSVGVRVRLSTGEYAIVVERYKGNDAAKPTVKTLVNPPDTSKLIDLRKSTNITITQIIGVHEQLSDKIGDKKVDKIMEAQLKSLYVTNLNSVNIPTLDIEEKKLKGNKK